MITLCKTHTASMPIYHQIKSLADEQRLLKEIIDLETQIRVQRERAAIPPPPPPVNSESILER